MLWTHQLESIKNSQYSDKIERVGTAIESEYNAITDDRPGIMISSHAGAMICTHVVNSQLGS